MIGSGSTDPLLGATACRSSAGNRSPQLIQTYIESFTPARVETWMATFGPDGTYRDPNIVQPTLMRDLREHFLRFFAGLPDATTETTAIDPVSEHLWVWRWVVRGTNNGPFYGHPPTGRGITIEGCEIIEVKDGQIQAVRGYSPGP